MRQKIIAGNWKMNTDLTYAQELVTNILSYTKINQSKVIFFPPFPFIQAVSALTTNEQNTFTGAQNISQFEKGAYTGEVNADMLCSVGVQYVLVGHSERREYFAEDDMILIQKIQRSLDEGLKVIFCCGESLDIRNSGQHESYVIHQIENVLGTLTSDSMNAISIAYEPIWAIGTGMTASPEQAQDMHAVIRKTIGKLFGEPISNQISILYGGSLKAGNAESLFSQNDIDGGLIGGASLLATEFSDIIQTMEKLLE